MLTLDEIESRNLLYLKEMSMLKIHLKLMAFVMVSITFYEKIITSDDEQSNNNSNQMVVYQLDLRPSARYAGVLYDANKKETEEEHARYHAAVHRVLRNRYHNNLTADQVEQRNLLFIAMPAVLSASSLSIVQEEGSKDSDDDSEDSVETNKWSTDVDVSVCEDVDSTAAAIAVVRRSASFHSCGEQSDASVDSKDVHDFNDADFGIFSFPAAVSSYLSPGMSHYPKNPHN